MNISELRSKITDGDIRPMKIVTIAMILGVLLFVCVGLYLYFFKVTDKEPNYDNSFIDILLMVLGVIFVGTLIGSRVVANSILTGENGFGAKNINSIDMDKSKYIGIYNSQHIVKLAMIEGSALFGCVVFLLSVLNNYIYATSYNWISLFPAIFLIIHNISVMPTKDKVIVILERAKRQANV